jgi:hypothetical protein
MKLFDMEASLAGRPLEISGLAILRQATMPAPTESGLAKHTETSFGNVFAR